MREREIDTVCIGKGRCEIQKKKEVPVWCTGINQPIPSTGFIHIILLVLRKMSTYNSFTGFDFYQIIGAVSHQMNNHHFHTFSVLPDHSLRVGCRLIPCS
jgi:hypothetical protein